MEKLARSMEGEFSDGFFYMVRLREFNPVAGQRVIETLRAIEPNADWADNKDLIELIWKLPFYTCAYRERCLENGADLQQYDRVLAEINAIVSEKMATMLSRDGSEGGTL